MKQILSRVGLILFAFLLLAGFEGGLRMFWDVPPLPGEELALVAIDPFRVEGGVARTDEAFQGAMQVQSFPVPKPSGRFRIFCLGGSTTMGYPLPPQAAWPSVLERRLRALHPDREIEVINVGGNAYGTGRLLAVLRGILRYEPDLLVVATGDTEFVEDSFRAAVALQPRSLGWMRKLHLSRLLMQVLPKRTVRPPVFDARDAEVAELVFSPSPDSTVYKVTAERRQAVLAGMGENLAAIVALSREESLPLLLCTLPSSLTEWPPDRDSSAPGEVSQRQMWVTLWQEGRRLAGENQVPAAEERFAAAARIWDGNGEFCYEYGKLLLRAGKVAQARSWLVRARDLDPTPIRSTSAAQALVRQAATGEGVFFADLAGQFDDLLLSGIAEREVLFDYAHPTPRGHTEIAAAVGRAMNSFLPGWAPPRTGLAAVDAAERERAAHVDLEPNADLCYVQGEVFERKGLFDRAEEMYRCAIERGNRGPLVQYRLARVLVQRGDPGAALVVAKQLVESHPAWSRAFALVGFLYERTGRPGEALLWYQKALVAGEQELELFQATARLLLQQGDVAAAQELLRQGLHRYPGDCGLSAKLGEALENARDLVGAEEAFQQILKRDPSCQMAWEGLGLLLMNQERWSEAAEAFRAGLEQPNPLPYHRLNLGIVYERGFRNQVLAAEQYRAFATAHPDKAKLVPPQFRSGAAR